MAEALKYKDSDLSGLIPVQIIGTQRSGSNLLRLMLNELKGVFAPHPPHILATFMEIAPYYGDLAQPKNFIELVADICGFVKKNPVPWRHDSLETELIARHSRERSLFGIYRSIYEINALSHDAKWWFNKSMQNVRFLEVFKERNFRPFLIHLVRDGRDVALSFRNAIVGDKHIYHLARKWHDDQELSRRYIRDFGPERAITIYYEMLLQNPEKEIRKICDLTGIPFSGSVMLFYRSEESLLTATSGEMWRNLTRPIMTDNYNKYKNGLTPGEIKLFERIAGDSLVAHGYQLEYPTFHRHQVISENERMRFEQQNASMKEEFFRQAASLDLMKREKQQAFLRQILDRKSISIPL